MTKSRATRGRGLLGVLLAILALWQAAATAAGDTALATPLATATRLATLAARPSFQQDALATMGAFLAAAGLSAAAGLLIGAALGLHRLAAQTLEPILASLYALPKVTLYPVVLLLFGLGPSARIAFGVMHGLIPIALITMGAVQSIPRIHLRTAASLRLAPAQLLAHVVWPALRPELAAALRIGLPLTLLGVLIGEMFASRRGLGAAAMRAMEANDTPTLMAIATLLTTTALVLNAALARLAAAPPGPG